MFHQAQVECKEEIGEQYSDMGLCRDFQPGKDTSNLYCKEARNCLISSCSSFFPDSGKGW